MQQDDPGNNDRQHAEPAETIDEQLKACRLRLKNLEELEPGVSLAETIARQNQLLALSASIGKVLTKNMSLQNTLQQCCAVLVEQLEVAFARIWTVNREGDTLELQASAGMYTHLDGHHSRIPIVDSIKIGSIAFRKQPHMTNAVIGDPQVSDQEWARQEKMIAFAGHPLLVGDQVVGVMGMFSRHLLHDTTLNMLGSIADEIALGIQRKQHEVSLIKANRTLRTLSICNELLIRATDEAIFYQEICAAIVREGGYALAWIGIPEHDAESTVRVAAAAGECTQYLKEINVSWADNERGQGPTGTAIRTGKTITCNNTGVDPFFGPWKEVAGRYGLLSSCALPLYFEGNVLGALSIYAISADFFQAEEVGLLQELANDLAYGIRALRIVRERDEAQRQKEKLQEQIRQSQKMEALGVLAGGIAHDFNNILSAVFGFAELAAMRVEPNTQVWNDIQEVIRAGRRARDLVSQILAFSRQADLQKRPISMHLVVKETIKLLNASLPKNIEIRQHIINADDLVNADPSQLHQIVMNICVNAYHAMQESGGTLTVTMKKRTVTWKDSPLMDDILPGPYVMLEVSDTGHGMSSEVQERIFEPYFTTKEQGKGTGMGLAVVHGIVKGHHGHISVVSEKGKGSTFTVLLPCLERPVEDKQALQPVELPMGKGEHILLVDDEEAIVRYCAQMLESLGYRVTARSSSVDALENFRIRHSAYDLVITDMTMPSMTGDHLAQKLLEIRPDIPIVMCTGFSETINEQKAAAIGIRKLVMKPLVRSELAAVLREILAGGGARRDQ